MKGLKLAVSNITYLFSTANKADKLLMPVMIGSVILECATIFINTIFPKYIIDGLTTNQTLRKVLMIVVLMVLMQLFSSLVGTIFDNITRYKKERLIHQYYKQFSDKTMSLDLQDVENPEIADQKEKAQRIITWNSMNIDGIKNALGGILSYGIQIIGFAYIIATMNALIIASVIIVMLLNAVLNNYQNKHVKVIDDKVVPINRMWNYLNRTTTEYTFGKIIRVDNLCDWLYGKCVKNRNSFIKENRKKKNISYRTSLLSNIISLIQEGFVYTYLIIALFHDKISYGDFYMYVAAVLAFTNAMKNIVSYTQSLNYTGKYVHDYRTFLAINEKMDNQDGASIQDIHGVSIKFENVSFRYPHSEKMVLDHINVEINGNSKISIVGDNGAGKTTFIKLLLRLYDPTEGEIYFNGVNIKNITTSEYRSLFSVVFQDYQMFPFTISENITYQDTLNETERMRLFQSLENVEMIDKVDKLPWKENTFIGKAFDDNGTDFSGGEIQKLALARSFFLSNKINILDEPTANLSPIAEYQIYKSYNKLVNELAIFISHRMSSSKFCDRILVFDKGKIIEDGTHEDLISSKGLYSQMYAMQASYYLETGLVKNNEDGE